MDMIEKQGERELPGLPPVLVSIVVIDDENGSPDAQALAASQAYPSLEVRNCPPDKLESTVRECCGEFTLFLPRGAELEPAAIGAWISAADADANMVYSDWDHIDAQGQRYSPRFTPAFSPALLDRTPYFGDCFLARTKVLRNIDWTGVAGPAFLHRVAIALSKQPGAVVRAARVLWHRRGPQLPFGTAGPPPGQPAIAVSIVICSRSGELLKRCLASLKPTLNTRTEVIVIAHEPHAGGPVSQAATASGARAISYQGAFHFGFMNRQGVQNAAGSAIVFLNDDVFPLAPDWLGRMAAHFAQPDVGVVGALLLYPSGKIQHAGVVVGGQLGPTHIGRLLNQSPLWPWLQMTREVTAVTGACMAIRRDVWDELGGFDPRFPVNYNDTDLCLRARKLGYRIILEADARLTHEESQSRNPRVRPEELALFSRLWCDVLEMPDPYFHPALVLAGGDIHLRSPRNRLK